MGMAQGIRHLRTLLLFCIMAPVFSFAQTAPAPVTPAVPEKSAIDIAFEKSRYMRNFDSRKLLKDAPWPAIKLDQYQTQLASSASAADFITAAQLVCASMQKEYEEFFQAEYRLNDYDYFLGSDCEQLTSALKSDSNLRDARYLRMTKQVLPKHILQQFDITYYNFLVSYAKNYVIKFDRSQRAYRSSLFGKLGIPYNSMFNAMQISIVIALLLSVIAAVKSLLK